MSSNKRPAPLSIVKRERQKKQERLRKKCELRDALPVLNREEIRRFRISLHSAILLELDEEGYTSAAEFLRQLIQFQEDLVLDRGPDSAAATRPRLTKSPEQLTVLYQGLKRAEAAHRREDIGEECGELIMLGADFGMGSDDWWWLGQQLLIQAVSVSASYSKDGGRKEATCKYIYGKFLFENLGGRDEAKELLTVSRQLATGKSWNASLELRRKQDSLYVESCILLYRCLLAEAEYVMIDDPLKASRICEIAKKRAYDACNHDLEAQALMLKGICEVKAGDLLLAIVSFKYALRLYITANNVNKICEARIQLGLTYLKLGKTEDSLTHLDALQKLAEENNIPYYIALAYRFLGEFYLTSGSPAEATPLLIKALNIFHDIGDLPNREQAKHLAAISTGQELMPRYTNLILKCGKPGIECLPYVYTLVRWKDGREHFWDEDGNDSFILDQFTDSDMDESILSSKKLEEEQNLADEDMERVEKVTLLDRSVDEPSQIVPHD